MQLNKHFLRGKKIITYKLISSTQQKTSATICWAPFYSICSVSCLKNINLAPQGFLGSMHLIHTVRHMLANASKIEKKQLFTMRNCYVIGKVHSLLLHFTVICRFENYNETNNKLNY